MKLFLDTNIFMRFFVRNDAEMVKQVKKIFSLAEIGKYKLATSTIVLIEIVYTLESFYKLEIKDIRKHIDSILEIKNLLLVDRTEFHKAFELYLKHNQKISDCLIATQLPKDYLLCSFDNKLRELTGKTRSIHPKNIEE